MILCQYGNFPFWRRAIQEKAGMGPCEFQFTFTIFFLLKFKSFFNVNSKGNRNKWQSVLKITRHSCSAFVYFNLARKFKNSNEFPFFLFARKGFESPSRIIIFPCTPSAVTTSSQTTQREDYNGKDESQM
jgi:hypothetical protein